MRAISNPARAYDLVINQRVSLHQQGLVSDAEFIELSAHAKEATMRIQEDTKEIKRI